MSTCPICGEAASESNINVHSDKGCPKFRPKNKRWSFSTKDDSKDAAKDSVPTTSQPVKRKPSQEEVEYSSISSPASTPMKEDSPPKPIPPSSPTPHLDTSVSTQSDTDGGKPPQSNSTNSAQSNKRLKLAPLAEQMRPQSSDDYIGQSHLMGPHGIFTEISRTPNTVLPSMVLWGPSGVGKTSLARVLAKKTQAKFIELSAPSAGSQDVKRIMNDARKDWQLMRRRTILFLDEIHRFNRSQQDSLLLGVERGDVTLIGATTENPSFKLSGASLSRMRVFVSQPLSTDELTQIVERAAKGDNDVGTPEIPRAVIDMVVEAASATGDARQASNMLETVRHLPPGADPKSILQHSMVYDQRGEFHYDSISAFHKSVRGSDADAALYYSARMLEGGEDPLYVSRRSMRIASEDIGLADDSCLPFAVAVHTSVQQVGMPECDVMLAHAAVKFARAPKSVEVYKALGTLRQEIRNVPSVSGAPVPMHLRNAPTKLMKETGYGHNYKYNPNYKGPVRQQYLPESVKGGWLGRFKPELEDG